MPDRKPHRFQDFTDPLELVDRTDIAYEARLAMLQDWQAALADADAPQDARDALAGAIQALEAGAEVQNDGPDAGPEGRVPGPSSK